GSSHEIRDYVRACDRTRRIVAGRRDGAELSLPHGHGGGAVSGRRIGRWRCAHPGAEAQRDRGPTLHRRESRRRRLGNSRRRCRRQGRPRRLHLGGLGVGACDQSVPVQERSLRRRARLHSGNALGGGAIDRQHHAKRAGEQPERFLRARAQGPTEIHLRRHHHRLRQPSRHRTPHDAGLDTLVIAYKGTAPALPDLMGGQIQLLADPMLSSLPLAQGGKIKALGLTSLKRATAAPDIPTVEESGVNGFAFVSWYGLWGPKNLPADLSNTLQADIAKVLALPDVKQRLNALGFDPIGSGGEQFATYIRDEMAKYEKIIKDAKIKVE